MGNKATPPRSFNTIRRSQTKVRAQRRKNQAVVLLAILATGALILLSLLVLGGFSIVNNIISANSPSQGQTPPPPSSNNELTFVQTTKSAASVHEGTLLLVNPQNEYKFPESAEKTLVHIDDYRVKAEDGKFCYQLSSQQYKLQAGAIDSLNAMMLKNYEMTGDIIKITDAYRTLQAQAGKEIDPGYSDHHTGYCFSIRDNSDSSLLESDHWIYQNCHKYGFVVRYPEGKESWTGVYEEYTYCLRYVGVAHATYMYQNNLCLEEYLDLLKNSYSSAATRLTISAADGFEYDVYYVAASGSDVTTIDVPTSNYEYTVSGDNRSGFIVTVKKTTPAA